MKPVILDASALIALIFQEKGAEIVEKYLSEAIISTVNLSEVFTYLVKKGLAFEEVSLLLNDLALEVIDFTTEQAFEAAKLYQITVKKGLSLGDRACLALAVLYNMPVLTADKVWHALNLGIKIEIIR